MKCFKCFAFIILFEPRRDGDTELRFCFHSRVSTISVSPFLRGSKSTRLGVQKELKPDLVLKLSPKEQTMEHLQFPVGKHHFDLATTKANKDHLIETIRNFPNHVIEICQELGDTRIDHPYRPDGWTGRQVVHHVADSHMHAIIRFKLTLTEEKPIIKPYDEGPTADLSDYSMELESAILTLQGVHARWHLLLITMSDADFDKVYIHPQYGKEFSLWEVLSLYDWHCRHHLGHLNILR